MLAIISKSAWGEYLGNSAKPLKMPLESSNSLGKFGIPEQLPLLNVTLPGSVPLEMRVALWGDTNGTEHRTAVSTKEWKEKQTPLLNFQPAPVGMWIQPGVNWAAEGFWRLVGGRQPEKRRECEWSEGSGRAHCCPQLPLLFCQLSCSHPEAQTQPLAPFREGKPPSSGPPASVIPDAHASVGRHCRLRSGIVGDQLVELRCCC